MLESRKTASIAIGLGDRREAPEFRRRRPARLALGQTAALVVLDEHVQMRAELFVDFRIAAGQAQGAGQPQQRRTKCLHRTLAASRNRAMMSLVVCH